MQAADQGSTESETAHKGKSTTPQTQASGKCNGWPSTSGESSNTHPMGLRSGDDGDDSGDPDRTRRISRGHEVEVADRGRGLVPAVSARFLQCVRLREHGENVGDYHERARHVKRRSCSCSNGGAGGSTVHVARRSGSAPARIRVEKFPPASTKHPLNSDIGPDLGQALIRRASMLRASDITGESTGDAPWVSPIRPSRLNTSRRGYHGYGGYGGLANLPDKSTRESNPGTGQTLLGGYDSSVDNRKVATIGDSFSFASSTSHVSQPVALVESQPRVPTEAGLPQDRGSVISQCRALLEGPPRGSSDVASLSDHRSVISQGTALLDGPSSPLDDSGLLRPHVPVHIRLSPTVLGLQALAKAENAQRRGAAAPRISSQTPLCLPSLSVNDLATYSDSRTRTISHGMHMHTRSRLRQTQASSLASLLCCCNETSDDTEQSSSDSEWSSPENAHGHHLPNTDHTREATVWIPGETSTGMDRSQVSNPGQLQYPQTNPNAGRVSRKCPRTRFAGENERWRDPTPRM